MRWAISSSRRLGAAAFAAAALGALAPATGCERGPAPPSIVVVTLDTLRRDHVGAYGAPGSSGASATPRLDELASRGLVHEAAFTTMPTTGPAHLSIFTGLYTAEHGSLQNGVPLAEARRGRDVARQLRAHGWATAAFVTTRLLAPAATGLEGFEVYDAPRGVLRPGREAVEAALAWLGVERRRPVLLWVHVYDAHAPYGDADTKRRSFPVDASRYGWVDPGAFPPAERARMAALYRDGVASADAALGALLDGLPAHFATPPLVIVAADHGESLDEHLTERGYAYDHGEFLDPECVRVPLVVVGPGVPAGRSSRAVSLRDVYTTILAAADVGDPLAEAEGRVDLRVASAARRRVAVERRAVDPGERPEVSQHRAAASDGHSLVIVDERGRVAPGADGPADLVELARALAGVPRRPGPPADVEPGLREALRALGYAR